MSYASWYERCVQQASSKVHVKLRSTVLQEVRACLRVHSCDYQDATDVDHAERARYPAEFCASYGGAADGQSLHPVSVDWLVQEAVKVLLKNDEDMVQMMLTEKFNRGGRSFSEPLGSTS